MVEKAIDTRRIKDARGKPVSLLDPYALNLLRQYQVIQEETLRRIAGEVGLGLPTWQRRAYFAAVTAFLGIWIFLFTWKAFRGSTFDTLACVLGSLGTVLFAVSAIIFWRGGQRARAKLVCAIMLKYLRCPHCGYDIRGLPTAPEDGATVCPECGCAWRLDGSQGAGDHGNG